MRRTTLLVVSSLLISGSSYAVDILQCDYAKTNVSDNPNAPLIPLGKEKVEFSGNYFKAYRLDGSFVFTPPLTSKKDGMIYLDDKTRVFAASLDKTNFAFSDKIGKTIEQWASCVLDPQSKLDEEMKSVESMSSSQSKKYFLTEKHAFTTNCLTWNDVTMITGKVPAMIIAGSVNMGRDPQWDGREYSFTFNNGTMVARFTPSESRHKFVIQAGDKFYGCGPSEIDHNYD